MVDKQLQKLVESTIPSKDGRIRVYIESLGVRATSTELRLAEIIRACVAAGIPIEKIAADLKTFGDAEIVKEAIKLALTMVGTRDGQEFIQAALGKLLALYVHQVDGKKTVSVIMPPRGNPEEIALQSAQRNYSTAMHKFNEFVKACKGFQKARLNYQAKYSEIFQKINAVGLPANPIGAFKAFLIKSHASSLQEELHNIGVKLGELPNFDYREADIADITDKSTDEVNAQVARLNAAIASMNMGHYLRTAKILKTAKTDHVHRLDHLIVDIQSSDDVNIDLDNAYRNLTDPSTNKRQYSQNVNTLVNEDFAKKVLSTSGALPGVLKTLSSVKKEALQEVGGAEISSKIVRLFGEAYGRVPLSEAVRAEDPSLDLGGGGRVQYGGAATALEVAEAAFNAAFARLNATPIHPIQEGVYPDLSAYDDAYLATEIAGHAVSEQLYALGQQLEEIEELLYLSSVKGFMEAVERITGVFAPPAAPPVAAPAAMPVDAAAAAPASLAPVAAAMPVDAPAGAGAGSGPMFAARDPAAAEHYLFNPVSPTNTFGTPPVPVSGINTAKVNPAASKRPGSDIEPRLAKRQASEGIETPAPRTTEELDRMRGIQKRQGQEKTQKAAYLSEELTKVTPEYKERVSLFLKDKGFDIGPRSFRYFVKEYAKPGKKTIPPGEISEILKDERFFKYNRDTMTYSRKFKLRGGGTRKSRHVCRSCGHHDRPPRKWKTQRKPRRQDDEHQVEVEIVAL